MALKAFGGSSSHMRREGVVYGHIFGKALNIESDACMAFSVNAAHYRACRI